MNHRMCVSTIFLLYVFSVLSIGMGQDSEWPDPVANDVKPYYSTGLTHGPMLGRPNSTSIRVWIRTKKPIEFRVVYDTELPLTGDSTEVSGQTLAEDDNTGVVDLTGLTPNTRYYYGILIDGVIADIRMNIDDAFPSFRTLPDGSHYTNDKLNPKGLFNLCFSVGCGANQNPFKGGGHYTNPPAFKNLFERHGDDLMFHIMNGDYIYEELRDGTVDGIRSNYKLYMERGRTVSKLFRYVPGLFTFDDHEVGANLFGSGEVGVRRAKCLVRDKALKPWYEYAGWANFDISQRAPIRYGHAEVKKENNILYDYDSDFSNLQTETVSTIHVWPKSKNAGVYDLVEVIDKHRLRVRPKFRADEECAYSIGSHHYYDWKIGNCHFFALDTRGERSRFDVKKRHDPDQFLLGKTQRQWLIDGVRNTDADFIFIVSPVGWTIYHTAFHVNPSRKLVSKGDGFPGYVHERELLLKVLDELGKPVVIFTGDLHNSFSVQVTDNVWEMMCSPMNSSGHPRSTAGGLPFGGWFDSEGRKVKIKWMGGLPDDVHYSRLNSIFYTVVAVNNVFKSTYPEGKGIRWIAYNSPQVVVRFYDGYTGKLLYAEGISKVDIERNQ